MSTRVFQKFHFVKKKYCNTSTHPSGVYINQIQKNFFPKSSLEGQTSWSKMVKTPVSVSPSFSLPASSSSPLLDLFLVLFAPVSLFPATSFLRLAILEKNSPWLLSISSSSPLIYCYPLSLLSQPFSPPSCTSTSPPSSATCSL